MSYRNLISNLLFTASAAILLPWVSLHAQDSTRYLFGRGHVRSIGIYAAPEIQAIQLDGSFHAAAAASAGIRFNDRLGFGVSMQRSIPDNSTFNSIAPLTARMSSMAVKAEYTLMPYKLFHINIPLMIGHSRISADSSFDRRGFDPIEGGRGRRGFADSLQANNLFIQPGAEIELNLLRFARFFAGVNYRYALSQSGDAAIEKSFSNGFNINAGLRVGFFNVNIHKRPHLRAHRKKGKDEERK